jgi:thiamine-phosphate pyrophosphorylase
MTVSNRRPFNIAGLYAITPDLADTELLCQMVEASILGGARVVQYRNKVADQKLRIKQSLALLEVCRKHGIPLIINDYVELCLTIDADGVHIGGDDGNIAAIKNMIGEDKILGVSCYGEFSRAEAAEKAGADYVAFGACFPSSTKPNAPRAELDLFTQAKKLNLPSVAIGGITLENAASVAAAGADAIAVIGELFKQEHDKIRATAQQFSSIF